MSIEKVLDYKEMIGKKSDIVQNNHCQWVTDIPKIRVDPDALFGDELIWVRVCLSRNGEYCSSGYLYW